jgi:hypothetical protein
MSYGSGSESEVVLFFGSGGISHALLYSDFEAVLDGVVGMQDFAGQQAKAAYVTVNGRMQVTGMVLFYLAFDDRGVADRSWNIPLRAMADKADRGPDLGAGAVRLACRSQCPISWHQNSLADPNMRPGENDFVLVRDAVLERGQKLGLSFSETVEAPIPPNWGMPAPPPAAPAHAQPVYAPPPVLQPLVAQPAWGAAAPQAPAADPALVEQLREERIKLARSIKDLRLQIATMETQYNDEIAHLNYAFQQKEEIFNSQLEKLLGQFKSLKQQNAALREQASAQRAQIESLQEALERQAHEAASGQSQLEELRRQAEVEMNQRLEEESARLREEIHVREMDLINRDDVIDQLREEITELRKSHAVSQDAGADRLLEKLEKLGVNFIAFHPGAGHISIPFKNVQRYVDNPQAYAAEKCLVTEERYRAWLAHYENPVCTAAKAGVPCQARLIRVDTPSKFKPGDSDICPKCQGDKNIANVLSFR